MAGFLRILENADRPGSGVSFLIPTGAGRWRGKEITVKDRRGEPATVTATGSNGHRRQVVATRARWPLFPELTTPKVEEQRGVIVCSEELPAGRVVLQGEPFPFPWVWIPEEEAVDRLPAEVLATIDDQAAGVFVFD